MRWWITLAIIASLSVIILLFMRHFDRTSGQHTSEEFCRGFEQGDLDNLVQRSIIAKSIVSQLKQTGVVFTERPDEAGVQVETRRCAVESIETDTFGLEWWSILNIREYGPNTPDATYRLTLIGHGDRATECYGAPPKPP